MSGIFDKKKVEFFGYFKEQKNIAKHKVVELN
jgi:hypothetical protein